jgi:hypothetical protein
MTTPPPPILSFKDWLSLEDDIPLLNLSSGLQRRTLQSLQNRTIVSIPLDCLREQSFELPPRNIAFVICVDNELAKEQALDFLIPSTKKQQQPWNVLGVIQNDLYEEENETDSSPDDESASSHRFPLARLWQPDPMIASVLLPLLQKRLTQALPKTRMEIWDVGAGAGRDVCFLAEELQAAVPDEAHCSFRVIGMDQRYRTDAAIKVCQAFAERRQVSKQTGWRNCHLGQDHVIESLTDEIAISLRQPQPSTRTHCVYAVRYWNKPLVQALKSALDDIANAEPELQGDDSSPLFLFAVSHFAKPTENANWEFEHPKEHHVLRRNELRELFDHPAWTILHDEIVMDTDHGRTLLQFVVERTWSCC